MVPVYPHNDRPEYHSSSVEIVLHRLWLHDVALAQRQRRLLRSRWGKGYDPMPVIRVENDAHWRALRAQHIGGSEVAALFGENPYLTAFELWHRKAQNLPEPDLSDNERVFWGDILEPAIAAGVSKKKPEWTIRKVRRYHSKLPELALGGSLDHEIVATSRGPGVLEIKTADWLVAKRWEDDSPPLAYDLQLQTYFALTGRSWGCMAVLIGGNELRLFEYERRPKTIEIIEAKVAEFWKSIKEGREPKPDFAKDAATVGAIYASTTEGRTIDLSMSNRAPELLAEYAKAQADEKDAEIRKKAAKAELLTLIGSAERAFCGEYTVSCKMIGSKEISYTRSAYRDFRISEKKAAAA